MELVKLGRGSHNSLESFIRLVFVKDLRICELVQHNGPTPPKLLSLNIVYCMYGRHNHFYHLLIDKIKDETNIYTYTCHNEDVAIIE